MTRKNKFLGHCVTKLLQPPQSMTQFCRKVHKWFWSQRKGFNVPYVGVENQWNQLQVFKQTSCCRAGLVGLTGCGEAWWAQRSSLWMWWCSKGPRALLWAAHFAAPADQTMSPGLNPDSHPWLPQPFENMKSQCPNTESWVPLLSLRFPWFCWTSGRAGGRWCPPPAVHLVEAEAFTHVGFYPCSISTSSARREVDTGCQWPWQCALGPLLIFI